MANVVRRDAMVQITEVGNIAVIVWAQSPDLASMRSIGDYQRALYQKYPQGIGTLVVSRLSEPLRQEIVEEASRQLGAAKPFTIAMASVQENTGVMAKLAKASMSCMVALSKGAVMPKSFNSSFDAAKWLVEEMANSNKLSGVTREAATVDIGQLLQPAAA